ncbi:MAG TPA: hypothetical protein VF746_14275 [Longimicrobium sp.]|jgi:hypothetical protein
MHPDEAVSIAIQDLRSHLAPARPAPRFTLLTRSLWRRYLAGWTWYVQDGRAPQFDDSPETGHLGRFSLLPTGPARARPVAAIPADGARLAAACCGGEGRVRA